MPDLDTFLRALPKVELHLHIEGTLEPELIFEIARRNGVPLRFGSVEEVRRAYAFHNLQSFLDIYYEGAGCLRRVADFRDMALAYYERAAADGVRHAEIFFDPQTHTDRGVAFETVLQGLEEAGAEAQRRFGLTSGLIPCFLRHLPAEAAMATLEQTLPYRSHFLAVGLDSSEVGHPPAKFRAVFDRAREAGLRTVAHAGEEGPPAYIWEALDLLGVSRVDHGVRCLEDPALVARLAADRVPLTVCPLSNVKLRVVDRIEDHPLKRMLDAGLAAMINSDDPAYFGGYLLANYQACARGLALSEAHLRALARNAIEASFLAPAAKAELLGELAAVPALD